MRIGPVPLALVILGIWLPIFNLGFPRPKVLSTTPRNQAVLEIIDDVAILPLEFSRIALVEPQSAEDTAPVPTAPVVIPEAIAVYQEPEQVHDTKLQPQPIEDPDLLKGSKDGRALKEGKTQRIIIPRGELSGTSKDRERQDFLLVSLKRANSKESHAFRIGLSGDAWVQTLTEDFPELPLEMEWMDRPGHVELAITGLLSEGYSVDFIFVPGEIR